ncbi:MAG TPA: zinc ribbon domain-containing protein [Thermoplasmata archaeon]|nr:zinc ribbon domain-containing protein [Thermoplasmata archaeon]
MSRESGSTAQTLILIGLIFQLVEVVFVLAIGLLFVAFPIAGAILFGLAFIGLLWLVLVYLFSYGPTREGDYEAARTPTLVFAILSLLTGSLIAGILYIVAYVKLGDAETPLSPAGYGPNPFPYGPSPTAVAFGTRYCARCGTAGLPGAAFCRSCGAALG